MKESKKKWRMIVYEDQGYPPNYIDDSFLEGLKDKGFKKPKLKDLFKKMLIVTDHISGIIILGKLYFSMKSKLIKPSFMYLAVLVCLLIFILFMFLSKAPREEYVRNLRMIFITYFTLELFQGVLQTLISSFSDDTVYALALSIALFHILTQSYDLESVKQEYMRDEDVIPMNCMLLTSIVLASRLEESKMASSFIQFSILFLSLLPRIRIYIQHTGITLLTYGFTLLIVVITCLTLDTVLVIPYLLGIFSLDILLPLLYIYFQKFKRDITGPWDPDSIKKMKKLKKPMCEIEITFPNNKFCEKTLNVLETEEDSNPNQSIVKYKKSKNVLNVSIQAVSARALRQNVNSFYESCYLVVSMLEQFLDKDNEPN